MRNKPVKRMFSLSPVSFQTSPIEGRGVFARRAFAPGDVVVAYAPKQRRIDATDPEAVVASRTKLTLLSEGRWVIAPDTNVPGGWLCNHSCNPNAAIFSDGEARIQCTRAITPGEEVTIFYGWVTTDDPARDPCHCGSASCRGFINFDVTREDAAHVTVRNGELATTDERVRRKLDEYAEFLRSIGQEHVQSTVASVLQAYRALA